MRQREILKLAKEIAQECLASSCESARYGALVMYYAEKGAQIALGRVSHLLPDERLDPLTEAAEAICENYGFAPDSRAGQAVLVAVKRGCEILAASGTEAGTGETERLDPKGDGPVPKADALKDRP